MTPMAGFDVAKKTVVAAIVDARHQVLMQPQTLTNEAVILQRWLQDQQQAYPGLAVCCESTSYYHYALVRACATVSIPCRVLNPIVTKQATKATIRGKKTDASDAILIAQLGLRDEGTVVTAIDTDRKALLRTSNKLQMTHHSLVLIRQSLTERGVPQPVSTAATYTNLLASLDRLVTDYRQAVLAQTDKTSLQLLTSIPGIGDKTAAVLLAELGDIQRFPSVDKLVAYTGLDPRVRQSGTSLRRNTTLTKRGSPSLRRAIFLAANVARRHDPAICAYYQKKRAEGRTYTEAMMPTCRQLLTRIYAVWVRGTPYKKRADA